MPEVSPCVLAGSPNNGSHAGAMQWANNPQEGAACNVNTRAAAHVSPQSSPRGEEEEECGPHHVTYNRIGGHSPVGSDNGCSGDEELEVSNDAVVVYVCV